MVETLKVLFIEDDHVDQMAFRRLVEKDALPYAYNIVSSVPEARQALAAARFDIILSDYRLGGDTAFDVLPSAPDTPVIFVTGEGNEDVAVRAMKAGAYDYLIKDSQRNYLKILPLTIENTLKHKRAEIQSRELADERLRRETLQRFIHDASHDLRTPLTVLSTSLELANRYLDDLITFTGEDSPEIALIRDQLERIKDRCDRVFLHRQQLEQIIVDILEMIRIDMIEVLGLESQDLNTLVTQVLTAAGTRIEQKGHTLHCDRAPDPLIAEINAEEFVALIQNLVKNAIDYTPDGGTITVKTYAIDENIVLEIGDNGIGIEESELPHIFKRFYRIDKSRNMQNGGSGIGLAVARRIVELHHGRIEITSQIDEGTMVCVVLPKPGAASA